MSALHVPASAGNTENPKGAVMDECRSKQARQVIALLPHGLQALSIGALLLCEFLSVPINFQTEYSSKPFQ